MTIQEAKEFLDSYSVPYVHTDIHRMQNLMHELGDPQKGLSFIHVAGTNGKGSACAMLASVCRKAGYRTGLFTSPHLIRFNERIQVNGEEISDAALAEVLTKVCEANDRLKEKVNWFEIVTAVGLVWFARCGCDMVVLEVGVGGEFDGTNVIDTPVCAVMMNLGLDHTKQLGNTLEQIARTKAGIIKEGGQVVCYRYAPEIEAVIEERCQAVGATLHKPDFNKIRPISADLDGQVFDVGDVRDIHLPLIGAHQRYNTAVVLQVVEVLRGSGFSISHEQLMEGLRDVSWPVRMELVDQNPLFYVDGGHNPQCIEAALACLRSLRKESQPLVFLTGILKEKDWQTMVAMLKEESNTFVIVEPDSSRALDRQTIASSIQELGGDATICSSVEEGIQKARALATHEGLVCCIGSLYLAGEVLHWFQVEKDKKQ